MMNATTGTRFMYSAALGAPSRRTPSFQHSTAASAPITIT